MTRISGAPIPPNGAAQMRHRGDAGIRLKIRLARRSLVWPRVRNSRQNCSVSCPGGAFGLMTHSPRQGYPGSAISPPPASTGADLPVGIFARDLPVAEGPEVAAPDLEVVAIGRSPGQGPFRGASVTHHEMIIVAVMEDRQTRETCRQTFADPRLSVEAGAPRIGSSRRLKDSVIGEVAHHRVKVASVERCSELSEHLGVGRPHLLMPPRGIDLVPVRYRLSLPSHWPMQPLKGFRGPCRRLRLTPFLR